MEDTADEWDEIVIPETQPTKLSPEQEKKKAEEEAKKALAEEKRKKILEANAETARLNQEWKDKQKAIKVAERLAKEEKEAQEIREKQLARQKLEAELGSPEKIFKHDFMTLNKHKYVHQKINRNGGAPTYTGMRELENAADNAWKLACK